MRRAHFHKIKVKASEVSYVVYLNIFIIKTFAYLNNIIIISHSCTNLIMHSTIAPPSELHLSWFSIKVYVQLIILFSSSSFLLSSLACSWNIDLKLIKNSLHEWEISSHSIRLRSLLSNRARYLLWKILNSIELLLSLINEQSDFCPFNEVLIEVLYFAVNRMELIHNC